MLDDDYMDPSLIAEITELPENAIAEWALVMVGYLDEEGVPRFTSTSYGSPTVATLIGAQEIVKHELIVYASAEEPEDECEN